MRKWFQAIAASLALILMVGCIPIHTNGTTHYLVIGIGMVSVNNTNQALARVTKATVLGGYASENGGGIGYSSVKQIMVSTNADMVISVSNVPLKPLVVEVKK